MPSSSKLVVAPVATNARGRLASRGGRARNHDPLTVGARTFNRAALEYLQGCSSVNPGPAERAEQLKEVQRLTTLPGKSAAGYSLKEVTWKQVYTYWLSIRECEPSAADVQAEAQELFNGVKQVEGVSLEISPATRYGYVGVLRHGRSFGVSFVMYKKTTAAGHRFFSDGDMVMCAYARALASMFDEGDASALSKLEALYCKRYGTRAQGRAELRRKVSGGQRLASHIARSMFSPLHCPCHLTGPPPSGWVRVQVQEEARRQEVRHQEKVQRQWEEEARGLVGRLEGVEEYAPESDS